MNSINTKEYNQLYPNNDFVTLRDYNNSFYNRVQTSQLREVIAPGTVKYMNNIIESNNVLNLMKMQNDRMKQGNAGQVLLSENNAVTFDSDGFVKVNYQKEIPRRTNTDVWNSPPVQSDDPYVTIKRDW